MPGNEIEINNALRYYVGDSKMDELITWLDNNGIKQEPIPDVEDEEVDEYLTYTRVGAWRY